MPGASFKGRVTTKGSCKTNLESAYSDVLTYAVQIWQSWLEPASKEDFDKQQSSRIPAPQGFHSNGAGQLVTVIIIVALAKCNVKCMLRPDGFHSNSAGQVVIVMIIGNIAQLYCQVHAIS